MAFLNGKHTAFDPRVSISGTDRIVKRLTGENIGEIISTETGNIQAYSFYKHAGSFSITANLTTQIKEYAFAESGITRLSARNVTLTEGYICDGCEYLTNVSLTSLTVLGNRSFQDCVSLSNVNLPSITDIGQYAFKRCIALTAAPFRNGLTTIQQYAFMDSGLTGEVIIPDSVTTLGGWVFYRCTRITSAVIGTGVTKIGTNLFNGCSSMTRLSILGNVTRIGGNAFLHCFSLSEITLNAAIPPTLDNVNAFSGLPENYKIYVPAESLSAYQAASNWLTIAEHITAIE